jgi:CubicO group peptidase (beta-lactamase class C family)
LAGRARSEAFTAAYVRGAGADGALLEDVASQQKSLIALLIGVAADRALIDVAQPASTWLGEGWTQVEPSRERAISVLHLMHMTSGLTESLAFEAAPGARFFYNTPAYARLQRVLEAAAGQPLDALTRAWLTEPLGMSETGWRARPAELAKLSGNAWGLVTSPRDLARLGGCILNEGRNAAGAQIVSAARLNEMFTPTPANPACGRLWWLNGGAWFVDAFGARRESAFAP